MSQNVNELFEPDEALLKKLRKENKQRILYHFNEIKKLMDLFPDAESIYFLRRGKEKFYIVADLFLSMLEQYYNRHWLDLKMKVEQVAPMIQIQKL